MNIVNALSFSLIVIGLSLSIPIIGLYFKKRDLIKHFVDQETVDARLRALAERFQVADLAQREHQSREGGKDFLNDFLAKEVERVRKNFWDARNAARREGFSVVGDSYKDYLPATA